MNSSSFSWCYVTIQWVGSEAVLLMPQQHNHINNKIKLKKNDLQTPEFCLILDDTHLECSRISPEKEDQAGGEFKNYGTCRVAERPEGSESQGKGPAFMELQQSGHKVGREAEHSFCVALGGVVYSSLQNGTWPTSPHWVHLTQWLVSPTWLCP